MRDAKAAYRMSPTTGTSFPGTPSMHTLLFRLLLASASIVAYAGLVQLTPVLEALDDAPYVSTVFHLVVGAIFGALVMAPYARATSRLIRGVALAAASAAIYYFTIRFVVNGPAGISALATFMIAGACAALLCGAAVAVIAPRAFSLRLAALLVVAGAVGGAAFDSNFSFDPNLLLGHAAWQLLVCLALYFGQRIVPT
jgi:hypothetical protein